MLPLTLETGLYTGSILTSLLGNRIISYRPVLVHLQRKRCSSTSRLKVRSVYLALGDPSRLTFLRPMSSGY